MLLLHKVFNQQPKLRANFATALRQVVIQNNQVLDPTFGLVFLLEVGLLASVNFSFDLSTASSVFMSLYGFLLCVATIGFLFYRRQSKNSLLLRKYNDLVISLLCSGLFLTKVESFFHVKADTSVEIAMGFTLLPLMLFVEKSVMSVKARCAVLFTCGIYVAIRILTLNEANVYIILQIASVLFASFHGIRAKDEVVARLFATNHAYSESFNESFENFVKILPDSCYILDHDLKVLATNRNTETEDNNVIENASLNFSMKQKNELSKTGFSKKKSEADIFKEVKDIEFGGGEEAFQNFFANFSVGSMNLDDSIGDLLNGRPKPVAHQRSSRILLISPVASSKPGTSSKSDAESLGNLNNIRKNSKRVKTWLHNHSLYQILDMISKNFEKFQELYGKSFLTFYGKISENDSVLNSLNDLNATHLKQGETGDELKAVEIRVGFMTFRSQESLIVLISDKKGPHEVPSSAKSVNDYKVNLLASFSHELRTPLNGNLNFLETALQRQDISYEVKKEYLIPALISAKLLFYIISDILDYSQFSLNKISLSIKRFSILSLLEAVVELFQTQAQRKNVKIVIDLPHDFEIASDSTRLTQILINLLSNATKFTYEGSITLSVVKIPEPANCYKITIQDTGIGISSNEKKKILKILRGEETEKVGGQSVGSNLGLTTASRLALLLGPAKAGGITLESSSRGTKMSFLVENKEIPENQRSIIDMSLSGLIEDAAMSQLTPEVGRFSRSNTLFNPTIKREDLLEALNIEKSFTSNLNSPTLSPKKLKFRLRSDSQTMLTAPEEGIPEHVGQFSSNDGMKRLQKNNDLAKSLLKSIGKKSTFKYTIKSSKCKCANCILIVDDDSFNVMAAEKLFTAVGFESISAYHGKQAIEIIEARVKCSDQCQFFKFILMDCNMPVMDGYETTKYLKQKMANGELPSIPIIACTAFVTHFDAKKCFDSGMDDYITKPLSKEKINRVLEKWSRARTTPNGLLSQKSNILVKPNEVESS